jgi:protein required for attachment to host cells
MTTWLLAADDSRAFLYAAAEVGVRHLESFDHPASRAKGVDLDTDAPGRERPRQKELARRGAMELTPPPADAEADRFSREVCEHLRLALDRGEFDRLVIVSAPRFLGRLRRDLDARVLRATHEVLDKDWTTLPRPELEARLASLTA